MFACLATNETSNEQTLQIFDLGARKKLNDCTMHDAVEFWTWVSESTIMMVTARAVYTWGLDGFFPDFSLSLSLFLFIIVFIYCFR